MLQSVLKYELIGKSEERDSQGRKLVVVRCPQCGSEKTVNRNTYRVNKGGCCGLKHATVDSVKQYTLVNFRSTAKYRGIHEDLPYEVWLRLSESPCYYCDEVGSNRKVHQHREDLVWHCNGIDRLDSNIGYVEENCVPCCRWCNKAKLTLGSEDFIDRCRKVALKHLGCSRDKHTLV